MTPPVILVENTAQALSDLASGFWDARTLAGENRQLMGELSNLQSQNAALKTDLAATRQAAESLQSLPIFSGAPARCLYRDLGRGLLLVRLGSVASNRIEHDTPVLGAGGVIGRVIRVEDRDCWVEALTRESAAVAVVTPDGSTHGLAEGTGGSTLAIRFVSHRASLTVGEDLLTSGADGIYPPGFPVARIVSVQESGGPFLEITARPVADPTTIQSVWLLDHSNTDVESGRIDR